MMMKRLWWIVIAVMISFMMYDTVFAGVWEEDDRGWRWKQDDGTYAAGIWEWLDGNQDGVAECYCFDADGYLLRLTKTPDGYYVDRNGAWVEKGVVQIKTVARNFTAGWHTLDGKEYYFYPANILWRNRITPDNHYVDADGAKVTESEIDPTEMKKLSKHCRYIVFDKSSHFVELWQYGEKTHSFLATSSLVRGDKEVEGDWKTPEGEFYVCKMVPYSSYHLGIGVSYPSIEDAERGLAQGLISQSEYIALVNANKNGTMPNWYTRLGGEIEFHGNRQPTDCTRGCIGMRNEDIEVLYSQVGVGDKIRIQP